MKVFIRFFLYVRNFPNKFNSSSCGSVLAVKFHIFFADLRMLLGLLEYFDLLSSVYNSNIKFSFLSYFSLKIVIFSWVVEFLENILVFSLKQDLVYSQQSLAEERLLYPWSRREGSYKIRFVCPSFHLPISFLGIGSLVFSET